MGANNRELDAATAWHNLAVAIATVEAGEGDYHLNLATVTAAIVLLFEFPAGELLAQVEAGRLPARPVVSWLLHEAARLPGQVPPGKARELAALWRERHPGEPLIPGPPAGLHLA